MGVLKRQWKPILTFPEGRDKKKIKAEIGLVLERSTLSFQKGKEGRDWKGD